MRSKVIENFLCFHGNYGLTTKFMYVSTVQLNNFILIYLCFEFSQDLTCDDFNSFFLLFCMFETIRMEEVLTLKFRAIIDQWLTRAKQQIRMLAANLFDKHH